jgi:predicted lipase
LENIPKVVTLSSQKLVDELREIAKVTSRNKKNLEREKAQREQIPEPTPQYSRIEIRASQQKKTPESTSQLVLRM